MGRRGGVAAGLAHRTVEAVDRDEGQAVGADIFGHLLDAHPCGEQLGALGRVDPVEAAVPRRRRRDAHVHFAGAGIAHHLHDLEAGGAAHDRIVDQDDPLALKQGAVGIVLQLHAQVADIVRRLDEGAADIMRADDAELERHARLLGIADRRRDARIGHRDDIIDVDRILARQLGADRLAHAIDRAAARHRIGPREIDMLEHARARAHLSEGADRAHAGFGDDDELARLDLAHELGAAHVERDRFRREDHRIAELAHHQRPDAERIAAGDHALGRHADQRIGPLHLAQRIDEAIDQGAVAGGGDKVDDRLGIAGRLEDRTALHQLALEPHRVRDIAVMRHREAARGQFGEQGLDVAQRGLAGGGVADMPAGHAARQRANHVVAVEIAGDMAHRAVRVEGGAIPAGDARGLLAAMLKGVQAECDHGGRRLAAIYAKNTALLAELVVIERICGEHFPALARVHGPYRDALPACRPL